MRPLRLLVLIPLLGLTLLSAAEDPIADFERAMAGQDQVAKKAAIARSANSSVGTDDVVLPLLARATDDRQAYDAAVSALRARTGLQPAPGRGAGGYPAYPPDDSGASWGTWIAARSAARDTEEQVKSNAKAIEDAKKKAAAAGDDAPATAVPGAEPGQETGAKPIAKAPTEAVADPEFGGLDRITFRTGGSLLCYVLGKRLDTDGVLVSVRVMHTDQGGEETLAADLIARIEEDIR